MMIRSKSSHGRLQTGLWMLIWRAEISPKVGLWMNGQLSRSLHHLIDAMSSSSFLTPFINDTREVPMTAGPGGHSSITNRIVTVFGCTGFLGRYLVHILAKKGNTVVIPFRGEEDSIAHLKPMGDLGKIIPLRFDLESPKEIIECIKDAHVVINCIGRDYETVRFSMEAVNLDGAQRIARACKFAKVPRLIHISHMKASLDAPSKFLQLKAQGEVEVMKEFPDVTIIRPSILFGNEDRFLNVLGLLSSFRLGIPVLKDYEHVPFYPLYVADAAYGMMKLLQDDQSIGKIYQFSGPVAYDMPKLIDLFGRMTLRPTNPLPLSLFLYQCFGWLLFEWRHPCFQKDQLRQWMIGEQIDSTMRTMADIPGLRKLSMLEDRAVEYLRVFRHTKDIGEPFMQAHGSRKKFIRSSYA